MTNHKVSVTKLKWVNKQKKYFSKEAKIVNKYMKNVEFQSHYEHANETMPKFHLSSVSTTVTRKTN